MLGRVIAHEIGHVQRKHLLLYLIFFIGFMLISYAIYPLSYLLLFSLKPMLGLILAYQLSPASAIFALYALLLLVGIIIYFRYIFGFFIRNFERQADLFVFRLFPSAQPLIDTFDKIVVHSGQSLIKHPDMLRAVSTGQVNIAEFLLGQFGNEDPVFAADNAPFVATGYDNAWKFYQAQKPLLEKKQIGRASCRERV
mgnify:CR=1 FL=1